jgi:hypothetical protein
MIKGSKHMKTITNVTHTAFALFALAWFAFLPPTQAVCLDGCNNGLFNVWQGDDGLLNDTTGAGNTAFGWRSLFATTDGSFNTGIGGGALVLNNGSSNTAVGAAALLLNSDGSDNTAVGTDALVSNTVDDNTAIGAFALFSNDTGAGNTAVGDRALFGNTVGADNVAVGDSALFSLASTVAGNVDYNVAIGAGALANVTEGNFNVAIGENAGVNLTSGSQNIYIRNDGFPTESSTIRIGSAQTATYIAAISGQTASGGAAVYVSSDGKLGTMTSSRRFKHDINPMDKASEAIFALQPVSFRYKKEIDPDRIPQFGLVAEEVEKVNPDLVTRDPDGKAFTVRYEAVNAMLLNEFLKEHRKVAEQSHKIQEQDATITQFKKEMQTIAARLKEQDSKIQKVSARLEVQRAPAQTVANSKGPSQFSPTLR